MKYIVTAATLFLITGSAAGQITLTESILQNLIDKRLVQEEFYTSDTTGVSALLDMAGENQTWDITGFPWAVEDTFNIDFYNFPAGTIGEDEPEYATANLVQVPSIVNDTSGFISATYTLFNSSGFFQLGSYFIGDPDDDMVIDTLKSVYVPMELDIPFPFTYQTVVSDSVVHEEYSNGGLALRDTTAKEGMVDGWGTLVTPNGNFDVLRYRYEERTYSFGFVSEATHYEWWGTTGPIFSVSVSEFFTIVDVDIRYNSQTVTDITSIDSPEFETLSTFALQQNYPNPFNPTTTIPFELTEPGNVKLAVYDLLGREVEVLISAQLPVGVHEATWNPVNLPGGLYVARLEVDGVRQSRTMTLLK